MAEVNLLSSYPRVKRNIEDRSKATQYDREVACEFGFDYFDGDRRRGYGGYRYDGRWIPIAEKICEHWSLKPGDRVLDVGCAKGFLVKDLMQVCPGLEVFGIDISEYAVTHAEPEVIGRLHVGNALRLPFPDSSFSAVISINTIHNLEREPLKAALKELMRVAPRQYVVVDAYRSATERELLLKWLLTAKTFLLPEEWRSLFREVGYNGDYSWTILEEDK